MHNRVARWSSFYRCEIIIVARLTLDLVKLCTYDLCRRDHLEIPHFYHGEVILAICFVRVYHSRADHRIAVCALNSKHIIYLVIRMCCLSQLNLFMAYLAYTGALSILYWGRLTGSRLRTILLIFPRAQQTEGERVQHA